MKVKALLERIFFGPRVAGEPIGDPKSSVTIPGLVERPTEAEWKKEFRVSSQYSRFNPQSNFYTKDKYGDESVEEHNDMLRRIITGSM
jgi:hypothetical protein